MAGMPEKRVQPPNFAVWVCWRCVSSTRENRMAVPNFLVCMLLSRAISAGSYSVKHGWCER